MVAKATFLRGARTFLDGMDALDVAILRRVIQEDASTPMSSNPMRSLRSIARDLEVDKETVRQRLRRLQEEQFLWPSTILVNPLLAGLRAAHLWLDGIATAAKPEALSNLGARPGVVLINDYVGSALYALEFHPKEKSSDRLREDVLEIPGVQDVRHEELWFPRADIEIGPLDWRIVRGLQREPTTSSVALAKGVRLSVRTVRRRLQRMIEARALFVVPRFNTRALDGSIADLAVFYEADASKSEVDRRALSRLSNHLIRADLHNRRFSFFNLIIDNVSRTRGVLDWVESQPGVATGRLDFVQDRIEILEHVDPLYTEPRG